MVIIGLFLMSISLAVVAEKVHMHDDQANSNSEPVEEAKTIAHDHRRQKGLHPSSVKKADLNNGSMAIDKKTKRHDFVKKHK